MENLTSYLVPKITQLSIEVKHFIFCKRIFLLRGGKFGSQTIFILLRMISRLNSEIFLLSYLRFYASSERRGLWTKQAAPKPIHLLTLHNMSAHYVSFRH